MSLDYAKIKRLREALGLTQDDAAKGAGFKGAHRRRRWNVIESGKGDITITTLDRVAKALKVHPAELLRK